MHPERSRPQAGFRARNGKINVSRAQYHSLGMTEQIRQTWQMPDQGLT